jgi:alkaline phosphatase
MYYQIGQDLIKADFDFYAGSDFLDPTNKADQTGQSANLYTEAGKAGYTIARGYKDYQKKAKKTDKMILLQPESATDHSSLPFAIDRKKGDMSLSEVVRAGINFLSKDMQKGFFLMVEGGKIDWACHSNDAATVFQEVIDMDEAVKVAYEFYEQHPDETLIVITADHETGGLVLGRGPYELNLQVLKNQKVSENGFTKIVNGLRAKYKNQVSWEVIQSALKDNFGFWGAVQLNEKQEARLKAVYEKSFSNQTVDLQKSEYMQDEPIATEAKRIIDEIALLNWASGGHSAGFVPVYAIGAGAERFQGQFDNALIPVKIAEAAGYVHE